MNPMGLVPVLVDGEVTMFESNAIVRYLAARYGSGVLRPVAPRALAAAEQWMEWQQTTVYPLIATVFMGLVRTAPEQRDQAAIRAAVLKLPEPLAIADRRLADSPWFAGEDFSMGDIVMGCLMWRYSQLDIDRPATPHIDRWFKALQARQPYRDWVMVPVGRSPDEWRINERELQ
jgi:glutathione S-transferase